MAAAEDFVVVEGQEALKTYVASSGLHRVFCSQRGSPIISRREGVPQVRVRLGTLDTPLDNGPQAHIFTDSKASWWDIRDGLPQHPGAPPPVR